jgi:AcrR family transcriptional regulator
MDPRGRRTADALLRAGEEIFSGRPVQDVTVEEIAERAGVAVGSLYNHVGSKAGLHAAVVERALQADRSYMDRAYTAGRTPIEQLYAAADEYLNFYLDHPDYLRMLAFPGDPGQYPAGQELSERIVRAVDGQNARLVEALRRGGGRRRAARGRPGGGRHDPVGGVERADQPGLAARPAASRGACAARAAAYRH